MISRIFLAIAIVFGAAGAALADVKVNTPGARVDTPAGPVDVDIGIGSRMTPTDAWIGRAVYSSDGKSLGEVAALAGDGIYVDVGGFLGIGESRVLLGDEQIHSVEHDRIVLKLSENEAKSLPTTDSTPAPAR